MAGSVWDNIPQYTPQAAPQGAAPAAPKSPWESIPAYDPNTPQGGQQNLAMTNLPPPSQTMFQNMDDQTADAVYNSYKNHPNAQVDKAGNVIYNGQPVPKPGQNDDFISGLTNAAGKVGGYLMGNNNPMTNYLAGTPEEDKHDVSQTASDLSKGAAGGVINTAHNIGTGATALGMELLNGTNDVPESTQNKVYKAVDNTLPSFQPRGEAQRIGDQGTQIAAGIALGNKLSAGVEGVEALSPLASKLPAIVNKTAAWAASTIAGGAGVGLTSNGGHVFTGPNAEFKVPVAYDRFLKGMDENSSSDVHNRFANMYNTALDNMAIATGAKLTAPIIKGTLSLVTKGLVMPVGSLFSQSLHEQKITDNILDDLLAKDRTPEQMDRLRRFGVEAMKPENSTISYDAGLGKGPQTVKLDTASALSRYAAKTGQLDNPDVLSMTKRAQAMSNAAGGDATRVASEAPQDALNNVLTQTHEALGGPKGVQAATNAVQTSGQQEVGSQIAKGHELEGQANQLNEAYPNIMSGKATGDLTTKGAEPGSAMYNDKNTAIANIDRNLFKGIQTVDQQGADQWRALSGTELPNPQSFEEKLVAAKDFLDKDTKQMLLAHVKFDPETGEVLGGDLGDLQKMRGPLSLDIAQAQKAKNGDAQRALIELKNEITDGQVSQLDPETQQKFRDAESYYKNVQSPIESGAVGDVRQNNYNNRFNAPNRADTNYQIISNTLTANEPNRVQHLIQTLADPKFGGSVQDAINVFKADLGDTMRAQTRTGDLKDVNPSVIFSKIDQYRQMFKAEGMADQSAQLDKLENDIQSNRKAYNNFVDDIKTNDQSVSDIQQKVYGDRLSNFFSADGKTKVDGYKAFSDLFSKPENATKLSDVISRVNASNDPVAKEGMQAAFGKTLQDTLFKGTPDANTGKNVINTAQAVQNNQHLMSVADKVLADKPDLLEAVKNLADPAIQSQLGRSAQAAKGAQPGVSYKEVKSAQNRITGFILGPLSHLGTQIGGVTGALVEHLQPERAAEKINEAFWSDPEEAQRMLKNVRISGLGDPKTSRMVFNWAVRTRLSNSTSFDQWQSQVKKYNEDQQTQDMMQSDKKNNRN
jgi:hypothetical protein